ncbi:hypothetical protein B0A49_03317 [Cryomyces minteri]|uniref:Uncharacterized protein n=1 Tax=Cryomyces minteri TaxID=331657 RepID=A0A4U0XHT4_9PEZI|nr:hypothetical protein B0A49_03317 [Cryomyces minteri]
MNTNPSLQLLPPKQGKQNRNPSRRYAMLPACPDAVAARAKPPIDLHEVLVQITTAPSSPAVAEPTKAHVAPVRSTTPITVMSARSNVDSPISALSHDQTASPTSYSGRQHAGSVTTVPPRPGAISPVSIPERNRAASPGLSDVQSALSGSPTLVRRNSGATNWSPVGSADLPVMRSIFPRYNPNIPLSQQHYAPTQASPTYIPREHISKAPYSPSHERPQRYAAISRTAPMPSLSTTAELEDLWNVASGQRVSTVARTYRLKLQRPILSTSPALSKDTPHSSQLLIGPGADQPFYTLSSPRCPSSPSQEVLLYRSHPSRLKTLPITSMTVLPPPSPPNEPPTQPILISHIFPKMAALAALDAASQSPAASAIARVDPTATSPQAARLATDAVQQAGAREGCQLVYRALGKNAFGMDEGQYELLHPRLGTFGFVISGSVAKGLDSPAGSGVGAIRLFSPSAALPSSASGSITDITSSPLAVLDFAATTLTLDGAALQRLPSPYIVDLAVAALLAVAVAESRRTTTADSAVVFAAPPSLANGKGEEKGGKKPAASISVTQAPLSSPSLTTRTGGAERRKWLQRKRKRGGADEEAGTREDGDELPGVTRGLLWLLGAGFRAVVWLLGVGVKVLAALVVGVSRVVSGKKQGR